jgi:signal transduction histidine kinase
LSYEENSSSGRRVSVSIEDSGAGISPADLPHIFERHYRAVEVPAGEGRAGECANRGANQGHPEGHGIGLALADHIARAHGAQIEVRSTEGSSVFRVTFAAHASANPQIAAIS